MMETRTMYDVHEDGEAHANSDHIDKTTSDISECQIKHVI